MKKILLIKKQYSYSGAIFDFGKFKKHGINEFSKSGQKVLKCTIFTIVLWKNYTFYRKMTKAPECGHSSPKHCFFFRNLDAYLEAQRLEM